MVDLRPWAHIPALGDSISVNGCCLTVASAGPEVAFDVIPETLAKTTLGSLAAGETVNLEHAVTASTLMGGHFVQGHVDGVGKVLSVQTKGEWRVRIQPPADLMPFMAPKGSVCVEGVSLTLAAVDPASGWFEVALIPTTLELTTLGSLKAGSAVNLEADMLAKTVVNYLRHFQGGP